MDELQNLDPNNPGLWPVPVQLVAALIVMLAIIYGGYKFTVTGQYAQIDQLIQKEEDLISSLEKKQKKAANLEALKEQMKEMEQSFGDLIRQLPNKTEVAGLLVDISQTGLGAGLEFNLFKPEAEKPAEFYSELPISISVVGNYHEFGEFVSGIAALPRIVTTHDIKISGTGNELKMDATAKTYKAIEEETEE